MLLYRILCAFLLAWGMNWSLSHKEAVVLLQEVPEMTYLGLLAAALAGYFNLAVRQGWGLIVALANGIWAGVLAIFIAGVLYVISRTVDGVRTNAVRTFDNFLNLFSEMVQPLLEQLTNVPLLIVTLGTAAVVGVITEGLHWLLVRMRRRTQGTKGSS